MRVAGKPNPQIVATSAIRSTARAWEMEAD
jgi:hypothetical protein